jgi:hypothetical protein
MPAQGTLPEQIRILLDHDQPMEHRKVAALYVQQHGDRKSLDALIQIVKGPWEKENDTPYLTFRRLVANTCYFLWTLKVKEGPPVFSCFPKIDTEVEVAIGPGRVRRGQLTTARVGTSLFEFHYEYPVWSPQQDFVKGHPKNEILVLVPDGGRIPIFDWCRQRHVTVICNRCGEDITYEVNQFGCKAITQNPAHPLFFPMRLGAIKQEISRLEKDIHDLEQISPDEGQAKLLAARERLEALLEEEKRIEVEWERLRERG